MKHPSFPAFVFIWNEMQDLRTPSLHARISRWLEESRDRGDRHLLLLAFRNSGKSTLVGLYCAWLLLGYPCLRILVMAADDALARKMVRNVKRIIERHPLTAGLKPDQADEWASGQFTINRTSEFRDPSMLAKGIGANVTGSRADVVICDDVEVPNTSDSAAKRTNLRERLTEIDYVLVPGGLQLYVGTPHTYDSIYRSESLAGESTGESTSEPASDQDRPFLEGFRKLELPILDQAGKSCWPERFPLDRIEEIRRRTGPRKFDSQMMLKPVNLADGRLNVDQLRMYGMDLDYREGNFEAVLSLGDRRLVSASCWWDPSYGAPRKGDASVVAAVFTDDHGDYWLHQIRYLTHDPKITGRVDEATQLCRQVICFANELYLPAVTIETNGLGRFLPGLLRRELNILGLGVTVIETASRQAKDTRIIDAFDAVLAAGRLHAHRMVWETPFINEMREWQPGSGKRDDGLDAVSGCLLSEPVRLRRLPALNGPEARPVSRPPWRPGSSAFRAKTDFPV